tara:strand:+ start:1164 stop:1991 length:828 start_codon:yes stop_codon:yes gene_type:complete
MPRRMRSKKNRKQSKSEAKVGQMRNGTRGNLQLSLAELSANRDYAGAQTHLKMRKDNLRALQLLANRLAKVEDLTELGVSPSQSKGLGKHFVHTCESGLAPCFSKDDLHKFPEVKGNNVVQGNGNNPKGQIAFCDLLEKVTKNLYKSSKVFAKDRVLMALKSLRQHFSKMKSASASNSPKSVKASVRTTHLETAKVRRVSNSPRSSTRSSSRSVRSASSNFGYNAPGMNNFSEGSHVISLSGDCKVKETVSQIQEILDNCGNSDTRQEVVSQLRV